MFGSYRINERKEDAQPRLSLGFDDGEEFNFYSCSVKTLPPAWTRSTTGART
jgi:endonuclease-8